MAKHKGKMKHKVVEKFKPRLVVEPGTGRVVAGDRESAEFLEENYFGRREGDKVILHPVEALYLINARRCTCYENNQPANFITLLSRSAREERIFAKYNVFRDWRDRGIYLQIKDTFFEKLGTRSADFGNSPVVKYPSTEFLLKRMNITLNFVEEDMFSFHHCKTPEEKKLFTDYWFGQLGVYKHHERDAILKFDVIETLFLAKNGFEVRMLSTGEAISFESLLEMIKKRYPNIEAMLEVYEDWRQRGYVVKTGFKFGTHFRIYFPGASPVREKSKWIHSKHVIHVFPKNAKMIMSEWARAVRVAHSVRKTFIMAIPGMKKEDYRIERELIDFIGFWRKKIGVEKPFTDNPRYAIVALTEDEELGGRELAAALDQADKLGLRLILAITDRETSVTYYLAKRIELPGSKNRYYEIEWKQP